MTHPSPLPRRLESLDVLRGLDLFMLVFLQPIIVAIGACIDSQSLQPVLYQLDHEVWEGFRCWDIVMPLFLFMTGAAMPFSLERYIHGGDKSDAYAKILRRFIILFVLGMVVQGNLLSFNPHRFVYYSNTLQAIASGYLIAAILMLNLSLRWQIVATALLLAIYSVPMALFGDYTQQGSFAGAIDALAMGTHRGDPSYTWIWSSLTFGVTVMLGTFAGRMMKRDGHGSARTALRLAVTGAALVVAGLLLGNFEPIIKRLWTSSMTLLSGGYCFLLMAFFYTLVDVMKVRSGLMWLKIYGMNSIAAYILGEVINFRCIAASLLYGLPQIVGEAWYKAILTASNFTIVFLILLIMYRRRIFLKI